MLTAPADPQSPPLPPSLIDTHVHLNFEAYTDDLATVAAQWRSAGIRQLVHSCCTPAEFPQLQAIADQYPEVFLAVGLHPLEAKSWHPEMATAIDHYASTDRRVVAIGETGLDFYKSDPASLDLQFQAFRAQIEIAQRLDRALIIHCRDAAEATLDILKEVQAEHPDQRLRAVMHCWSGTPEETRWFVDLGCWISFSGIVTFKNAHTVRQSILEVPADQLLVETDCPFLAPVPYRGKRNEPAFVTHVADTVAQVRQQSVGDLAEQTTANARALFRLPATSVNLG